MAEDYLGEEQPHPGEHDEAVHSHHQGDLARVHEIPVLEAERPEHEERQNDGRRQEAAMRARANRHDGTHQRLLSRK